ncbi:TPA: hypothetical protein ACH3X2_009798 [Trebouxia sp. C0005]
MPRSAQRRLIANRAFFAVATRASVPKDLAATHAGMSSTLEHKRAVTQVVKSLGLQADLRARAVVFAAADSTVGNSLRDLIQLNEDDPALKALVEEFLR